MCRGIVTKERVLPGALFSYHSPSFRKLSKVGVSCVGAGSPANLLMLNIVFAGEPAPNKWFRMLISENSIWNDLFAGEPAPTPSIQID